MLVFDCRAAAAQLLITRADDLGIAIILAAVSWLILEVVAAGPKVHARGSTPGGRATRRGSAYVVMGTACCERCRCALREKFVRLRFQKVWRPRQL